MQNQYENGRKKNCSKFSICDNFEIKEKNDSTSTKSTFHYLNQSDKKSQVSEKFLKKSESRDFNGNRSTSSRLAKTESNLPLSCSPSYSKYDDYFRGHQGAKKINSNAIIQAGRQIKGK